jgi:hypothetical protein
MFLNGAIMLIVLKFAGLSVLPWVKTILIAGLFVAMDTLHKNLE